MVYEIAGQISKVDTSLGYSIISEIKDSLLVWCQEYQTEVDSKDDFRISDGTIRAGVNLTETGGLVFYWIDITEYHQNIIAMHGLKPDSLNRGLFDFISGMADHSIDATKAKNTVIVMKEKDNLNAIQVLPEYVIYSAAAIYDPQNSVIVKREPGKEYMQGETLEAAYLLFKGFKSYTNALGTITQALMFNRLNLDDK